MKTLFTLLGILLSFSSYSQCNLYQDVDIQTHTKECQACYKKIKYPSLVKKIYWGNCQDKSKYSENLNCLYIIMKFTSYANDAGFEAVKMRDIVRDRCKESNSGDHLWKEVDKKTENLLTHEKVNHLEDNYYCDILESMRKEKFETYIKMVELVKIINEFDNL